MEIFIYALGFIMGSIIAGVIVWKICSPMESRMKDAEQRAMLAEAISQEHQKQYKESCLKVEELHAKLASESQARVKADAEKTEIDKRLEQEKKLFAEAENRLADTFSALAKSTLDSNTNRLLALVKETFTNLKH